MKSKSTGDGAASLQKDVSVLEGGASPTPESHHVNTRSLELQTPRKGRKMKGNPTPTGLVGFSVATLFHSLGHVKAYSDDAALIGTSIVIGALLQIIAGHYEYLNVNNNSTCIFYAYGFFWLLDGLDQLISLQTWAPKGDRRAGAWVFGLYAVYAFGVFVVTLKNKLKIMPCLLGGAFCVFMLSGLNEAYDVEGLTYTLGVVGLLTGGLAMYWALGMMFNEQWGKRYIPFTDHADDYDE